MLVFPSSFAFKSSHFDLVLLAIIISVNTSLFWQHFLIATCATPPHPIISNLLIFVLLIRFGYDIVFLICFTLFPLPRVNPPHISEA